MKKIGFLFSVVLILVALTSSMVGCAKKYDVTIHSSMEDFRNEKLVEMLKKEFPELSINLQYFATGQNAAKIKAEKTKVAADIVIDIDYAYLEGLKDNFATITKDILDTTLFLDELAPLGEKSKYVPMSKYSTAIIVNKEVLGDKPVPTSYEELTNETYRDLIMMPNPTASGTGYSFLKGMVELLGEGVAFDYFNEFQKNVKQFTSSGSGPVNSLVRGETAIGIGMVFQAVNEINKGAKLTIIQEENGLPYNVSGVAMIDGRQNKENVKEVFAFICSEFSIYDKINFLPEQIFKNQEQTVIDNYPIIKNINMGSFDPVRKEELLTKWKW